MTLTGFCRVTDKTARFAPTITDVPVAADPVLVYPVHCLHERQDTNWPPIDRRMIGRHATLFHDLHGAQLAQRIDAFQSMLTLKFSLPTCAAPSTAVCTIAPHSPMGRNQCR